MVFLTTFIKHGGETWLPWSSHLHDINQEIGVGGRP